VPGGPQDQSQARTATDAGDGSCRAWPEASDDETGARPPYLLRDLKIAKLNHVWSADITYLPIGWGFLYLVAIMDWASRAVLSWRLSNTMDASFCVEALKEALALRQA
jgi:transposase InsO family protein